MDFLPISLFEVWRRIDTRVRIYGGLLMIFLFLKEQKTKKKRMDEELDRYQFNMFE